MYIKLLIKVCVKPLTLPLPHINLEAGQLFTTLVHF